MYDTEIFGATVVFLAAILMRQNSEKIFFLFDDLVAVITLQTVKSSSSIRLTKPFHRLAKNMKVEFRWMLGYSKIKGNKKAGIKARGTLRNLP